LKDLVRLSNEIFKKNMVVLKFVIPLYKAMDLIMGGKPTRAGKYLKEEYEKYSSDLKNFVAWEALYMALLASYSLDEASKKVAYKQDALRLFSLINADYFISLL
jgi:hypothetical protein